ncbi:cytochrome P450 94B3 [Solanum stenotomum]|uniref:cytochrome P450 94B3 n=1 Tax=Solanum stenotomum TaxID=172797 RepID=UPI0020D13782|nr:cytochrome P450 94B3 [Solanum stenotomum]
MVMVTFLSIFTTYPFFILPFLCLTLILYLSYVIVEQFQQGARGFEGPPTYPIIGCLIPFYKNRYRLLDWYTHLLSQSPTKTIVIDRLGARRTIVTANPHNVEYMLKTNFDNFPKGKPFNEILGDFLGNGIFNVDGDIWYKQRKMVSHEFTARCLRDYVVNALKEEVENKLLPMLDLMEAENRAFDLQDLLRRLGFDVVCKVSLGFDPCCLNHSLPFSPLLHAFERASQICAGRGAAPISAIWKVKRWLNIGSERQLRLAIDQIHSSVANIIRERKIKIRGENQQEISKDLLSKLILAANFDEEEVRDMVISFIIAGRDTISAAMTWLFYLLTLHPEIENELVSKELRFIEAETLTKHETLREMKFLKACLCETMRLYPPVAWDSKHAIADDILPDGTRIKAGNRVTYFPYGMGRMENLWGKDRLEFKPERWMQNSEEDEGGAEQASNLYKFPVFQAGPRVCLGKELAFIQMKYVVSSILMRFQIRPACSDPPVFLPLLTAHMAGGFKIFVHKTKNINLDDP